MTKGRKNYAGSHHVLDLWNRVYVQCVGQRRDFTAVLVWLKTCFQVSSSAHLRGFIIAQDEYLTMYAVHSIRQERRERVTRQKKFFTLIQGNCHSLLAFVCRQLGESNASITAVLCSPALLPAFSFTEQARLWSQRFNIVVVSFLSLLCEAIIDLIIPPANAACLTLT